MIASMHINNGSRRPQASHVYSAGSTAASAARLTSINPPRPATQLSSINQIINGRQSRASNTTSDGITHQSTQLLPQITQPSSDVGNSNLMQSGPLNPVRSSTTRSSHASQRAALSTLSMTQALMTMRQYFNDHVRANEPPNVAMDDSDTDSDEMEADDDCNSEIAIEDSRAARFRAPRIRRLFEPSRQEMQQQV
jgi:hypothetical protein